MRKLFVLLASLFVLGTFAPLDLQAQYAPLRLSAQFRRWDSFEDSTANTPSAGGTNIYTKTVTVPPSNNVLFITYSATGDTHSFTAPNTMQLACTVDGANCTPGTTAASGAAGWIVVQHPNADEHDNSIHHEWCANITPSSLFTPHTIQLFLASANGVDFVFNEGEHIFIDTVRLSGGCTQSTTPASPGKNPPKN